MKERDTKLLRDKSGFSLVEIIIVVILATIVLYTVSYAFLTTTRTGVSLNRRSDVTTSLQNSVDRMVDELRVSEDVLAADNDSVTVLINGERVTFAHDAGGKEIKRNGAVIATNVEGVLFTYLDASGNAASGIADIRRIEMAVRGSRRDEVLVLKSSANMRKRQ